MYRGVEAETDLSRTVAAETAGSLIFHRGRAIEAVYSSHCGGHSANNEDIWGTNPIPYLRGRKDSYDGDSPVAEWSTSADADDVHDRLSKQLGKLVKAFEVSDRGAGNHVRSVKLRFRDAPDLTMRGERFRSILNGAMGSQLLRSSSFEIKKRSDTYLFQGKGNGHGVGFCQWGARAQAQEGRSYRDILEFYYKGIDITIAEPIPEAIAVHTRPNPEDQTAREESRMVEPDPAPASERRRKPRQRRPGW